MIGNRWCGDFQEFLRMSLLDINPHSRNCCHLVFLEQSMSKSGSMALPTDTIDKMMDAKVRNSFNNCL